MAAASPGGSEPPATSAIRCVALSEEEYRRHAEEILAIENSLFPQALAEKPVELDDVFTDPLAISIVAFENDELVGFVCGERLDYYVEPGDPEHDARFDGENTIYVETINVKQRHQGKGIGKALLLAFIAEVKRRGYTHVAGHWRFGASSVLFTKLGGRTIMTEDDYLGTGETYAFMRLDL